MRSLLFAALFAVLSFTPALAADPVEILPDAKAATGEITEITIDSMAFQTPEVKIKSGQIVRWTNKEQGMAQMSERFRELGSELYVDADAVKESNRAL